MSIETMYPEDKMCLHNAMTVLDVIKKEDPKDAFPLAVLFAAFRLSSTIREFTLMVQQQQAANQ